MSYLDYILVTVLLCFNTVLNGETFVSLKYVLLIHSQSMSQCIVLEFVYLVKVILYCMYTQLICHVVHEHYISLTQNIIHNVIRI